MLKRVNGKPVPNNPAKAYELGRLDGTKQCMDNVSCVLLDKFGFHVRPLFLASTSSTRHCCKYSRLRVSCSSAVSSRIKMTDIEKALRGEYKLVNSAE